VFDADRVDHQEISRPFRLYRRESKLQRAIEGGKPQERQGFLGLITFVVGDPVSILFDFTFGLLLSCHKGPILVHIISTVTFNVLGIGGL